MQASREKMNKELDSKNSDHPKKLYHETKKILVSISRYQDRQISYLCKFGIAKNPTDFVRMAIMDKIRENKELLEKGLVPTTWRKELKEQREAESTNKGN